MLTSDRPCILGLDVSTSNVGWALIAAGSSEFCLGYLPLASSKDVFCKALEVRKTLRELAQKFNIQSAYVEEDLQRFRRGFSSAKTLATLARFNGVVCQIVYEELSLKPVRINVNAARKIVGVKIDRKDKTRTTKEKVFEVIDSRIDYTWPTKVLKSGPRKGQTVNEPGCFDMVDAYVIAAAGKSLHPALVN
jgi:hypothetical protein